VCNATANKRDRGKKYVRKTTNDKTLSYWKNKAIDRAKAKVRELGRCEKCGTTLLQMHGSHIIPVRFSATAADTENILCLCAGCHKLNKDSWHEHPLKNAEWFEQTWPGRKEKLYAKAQVTTRYRAEDWKKIYDDLGE